MKTTITLTELRENPNPPRVSATLVKLSKINHKHHVVVRMDGLEHTHKVGISHRVRACELLDRVRSHVEEGKPLNLEHWNTKESTWTGQDEYSEGIERLDGNMVFWGLYDSRTGQRIPEKAVLAEDNTTYLWVLREDIAEEFGYQSFPCFGRIAKYLGFHQSIELAPASTRLQIDDDVEWVEVYRTGDEWGTDAVSTETIWPPPVLLHSYFNPELGSMTGLP